MSEWIAWLLGIENIRLAEDAPLLLRWGRPFPAWLLFCAAVLLGGLVAWIYRREPMGANRRAGLGLVRCAIVALVIVVLCQPVLVLQRNRVEPSHVVLLVDRSQSMAWEDRLPDGPRDDTGGAAGSGSATDAARDVAPNSRLELVRRALLRDDRAALSALMERNGVQLVTFDSAAESSGFYWERSPATLQSLADALERIEPTGAATDVAGAIESVLGGSQGRRTAAIVLASDGRTTQPGSLEDALDRAAGRQVPILPMRVGAVHRPRDLEVVVTKAPDNVFARDVLMIEVEISAAGLRGPTPVTLNLFDETTGGLAASRTIDLEPAVPGPTGSSTMNKVLLTVRTDRTGAERFRVEVEPLPDEWITENNVDHVETTVVSDRVRVLYVEGYPRFEYRYLKNALLREPTITLSVLLLQSDEEFVQEGTEPVRRFPQTAEELGRYDVVLFGDVDPHAGWLSAAQMNLLVEFVGSFGGGFGLIAGERAAPHRFAGTPLDKLVPVRIDDTFTGAYEEPLVTGFRAQLTDEGLSNRLWQFTDDPGANEKLVQSLPELYWIAATDGVKAGAVVLAEHPSRRAVGGPVPAGDDLLPVVVVGRYGAGKLFFQATDDTWRWRRHTGEFLHDTYWVQVVHELMPDRVRSRDRRFVLRTDQRVYDFGAPVRAMVEFFDAELLAAQGDRLSVAARPTASTANDGENQYVGTPAVRDGFEVYRVGADAPRFEGEFVPPHPGRYVLTVPNLTPIAGEKPAEATVRVRRPNLEMRQVEADHQTLERIARATGGKVLELDELVAGFGTIRDHSVQIPDDITEPLWDSKLVFMLFGLLLCTEWGFRKLCGLL